MKCSKQYSFIKVLRFGILLCAEFGSEIISFFLFMTFACLSLGDKAKTTYEAMMGGIRF